MQHSFSSQSFLKQRVQNRYKPTYQHDITIPKQQLSNKYLREYPSNDYYSNPLHPISQSPDKFISPDKSIITRNQSLTKLKKKIKQIKYALKIAEEHNQQLHTKLNNQKKTSHQQLINYEKDLNKYKSLYEMLIDNYEKKVDELNILKRQLDLKEKQLKQAKKVIKSYQKQSRYKNINNNQLQENDRYGYLQKTNINKTNSNNNNNRQCPNTPTTSNKLSGSRKQLQLSRLSRSPQIKQLLTRQQVSLQHLTHENKLLREQLILKNKKISQYQIMISTYQTQQKLHKSSTKQLSQLTSTINQLEQQNQKLINDKSIYSTKIARLQIQIQSIKNKSITTETNLTKTQTQNQHLKLNNQQLLKQINSNKQLINDYQTGQRKGKWKHMYDQLTTKYNQLLKFHYQNHKQIEKQIHLINQQIQRRQILKYNHR